MPYVNSVFTFLHLTLTDQDRTENILRSSIGLLGDLAEAFPSGQLKEPLTSPWVVEMLKAGRTKIGGSETKKVTKWAKEVRIFFAASQTRLTSLNFPFCVDGTTCHSIMIERSHSCLSFPQTFFLSFWLFTFVVRMNA